MQTSYIVEVAGARFPVPPEVEAEGGAAVQAYLEAQPGFVDLTAWDKAIGADARAAAIAQLPAPPALADRGPEAVAAWAVAQPAYPALFAAERARLEQERPAPAIPTPAAASAPQEDEAEA